MTFFQVYFLTYINVCKEKELEWENKISSEGTVGSFLLSGPIYFPFSHLKNVLTPFFHFWFSSNWTHNIFFFNLLRWSSFFVFYWSRKTNPILKAFLTAISIISSKNEEIIFQNKKILWKKISFNITFCWNWYCTRSW